MQDLEGRLVHSNYDPLLEAKRGLEKFFLKSHVLFFFGIGLGYSLEVLLETNFTAQIVYAWEPSGGSLEYEEVKKKLENLKEYFLSKDIQFYVISNIHELPLNVRPIVISLPYYQKQFPFEYSYLLESFTRKTINQTTKASFLNLWLRNFFVNLEFLQNQKVKFLDFSKKVLSNNYVLFCGASPILENQIEQIKNFRNKFFLISSDTAASFLIYHNVYPNAILSIDSGRGTIFHLRTNLPDDSVFFTWLGGNREIFFRKFKKYLFLTSFPLEQILQSYFFSELPILINPSLNIAGMAKAIAKELGAEKIIYAGTSFVSVYGKTHCRGTGYENYLLPKVTRKFSIESYRQGYKEIKDSKNELAFKTIFQDDFVLAFDEVNFHELPIYHEAEIPTLNKEINLQKFFTLLQKSPELINSLIRDYSFSQKNLDKYLNTL